MTDIQDTFDLATSAFVDAVAGIGEGDWHEPALGEWDVRSLRVGRPVFHPGQGHRPVHGQKGGLADVQAALLGLLQLPGAGSSNVLAQSFGHVGGVSPCSCQVGPRSVPLWKAFAMRTGTSSWTA